MKPVLIQGLIALSIAWLAGSLYVLISRWRYDREARALRAILRELDPVDGATSDPVTTVAAVERIAGRRSRRAVYRLVANTALPRHVTELFAAYSLSKWGLERMQRDALPDSGPKWRRISALFALAHVRAPGVHELLRRALADRDQDVASAALVALQRLGDLEAAKILVAALASGSNPASRVATQLENFPLPIHDLLLPLLTDERADARYWAVSLLRRAGSVSGLTARIATLATDPHPPVRRATIGTLDALGAPESAAVAQQLLDDPVSYVRAHAVRLYANAHLREGKRDDRERVTQRLAAMLGDTEWDARLAVKESLVQLGPDAWREIAAMLESPDRFARNGAAEVLQNLGLVDLIVRDIDGGDSVDSELVGVLERAFRAGGPAMVDAAAARSAGTPVASTDAFLTRLGFITPRLA